MIRLTRAQVREVDRLAIERYHIPGIVLMENAARAVTDVALEMLKQLPCEVAKIGVLCGGGNNGGDGLAVARHLTNRGHDVWVGMMTDPLKYRGDAAINWQIAAAMRLFAPTSNDSNFDFYVHSSDLIIDGLFGTGLESPPREPERINMINELAARILAIDLPSGMNCDTGEPMGACIRAERTVTFVAEKVGFANPASKQYTGEVTVGDIGCPRELIEEVARMPRP
jgi:NAD(P)H-hydrate epimerase